MFSGARSHFHNPLPVSRRHAEQDVQFSTIDKLIVLLFALAAIHRPSSIKACTSYCQDKQTTCRSRRVGNSMAFPALASWRHRKWSWYTSLETPSLFRMRFQSLFPRNDLQA